MELQELLRLDGHGIPLLEMTTSELAQFLIVIMTLVSALKCPSTPLRSKMVKDGPRGDRSDRIRERVQSMNLASMMKTCK